MSQLGRKGEALPETLYFIIHLGPLPGLVLYFGVSVYVLFPPLCPVYKVVAHILANLVQRGEDLSKGYGRG